MFARKRFFEVGKGREPRKVPITMNLGASINMFIINKQEVNYEGIRDDHGVCTRKGGNW